MGSAVSRQGFFHCFITIQLLFERVDRIPIIKPPAMPAFRLQWMLPARTDAIPRTLILVTGSPSHEIPDPSQYFFVSSCYDWCGSLRAETGTASASLRARLCPVEPVWEDRSRGIAPQ